MFRLIKSPVPPSFEPFFLNPTHRKFFQGQATYLPMHAGQIIRKNAIWIVVGLVFVIFSVTQFVIMTHRIHLQQTGARIDATVIDRTDTVWEEGHSYSLIYQFTLTDNNGLYSGVQDVDSDTYSAYPKGSQISVVYLPNNPNTSQLDRNYTSAYAWLTTSMVLGLVSICVLFYLVRPVLKDRRLAIKGHIIEGTVISSKGTFSGLHFSLVVEYQFKAPSSRMITDKQEAARDELEVLPEPGTSIAVLYLNEQLYKLL
jgi:hypothetical protein